MSDFELEALLSGALRHEKQTQTIAKARKAAVTARPGSPEFEEANAYVKQWERDNLWKLSHDEVLVVRDICTCGAVHETVQGVFSVYQHKTHPDRVDKRPMEWSELPRSKRTFVHETKVIICSNCYELKGFPSAKT